jgi:hypothetical protein
MTAHASNCIWSNRVIQSDYFFREAFSFTFSSELICSAIDVGTVVDSSTTLGDVAVVVFFVVVVVVVLRVVVALGSYTMSTSDG